jgi:DNA-binding LacI/PurR family transcriptional regulator
MAEILAWDDYPTAVICAADVVAIGALSAIKERNLRVPEQISVVSFGDIPLAGMLEIPLTSVRIPFVEIGQRACSLLIKWVKGGSLPEKDVAYPVELVIRQTTKAIIGK